MTGKVIGADIPVDHPYVSAGFRVVSNDLSLRAEALEHLISVSPDNLMAFCRGQTDLKMARLRSNDLTSGFKYIPSLYVERTEERERLLDLIGRGQKCVLVLGPPQVGKTNFLCHFVEEQLNSGVPCLFYPAVGVEAGVIEAIREDFEWTFGDSSSPFQVIHGKLCRVLERLNRRLLIVVEGLNENQELIRTFNTESERLGNENLALIVSFTTYSAGKILLDSAGNPTYAASAAGVNKSDVPLLEVIPQKVSSNLSAVHVGPFSEKEMELAYSVYGEAFKVEIPREHQNTNEPLLLRNAMEHFRGALLPATLDAVDILPAIIQEKLSRVVGIPANSGRAILEEAALRICEGKPMSRFWLHQAAGCVESFAEAALLSIRGDGRSANAIDFYVSSERAFVIAHWLRNWPSVFFGSTAQIRKELDFISDSLATKEALRWFFRQDENGQALLRLGTNLSEFNDLRSRKLVALCLCEHLVHAADDEGFNDDTVAGFMRNSIADCEESEDQSELSEIVGDILLDSFEDLEIRANAAVALGRFSPDLCLSNLAAIFNGNSQDCHVVVLDALEPGFREAVDELTERYYGSMCPGYLDALDDAESRLAEYERVVRTWKAASTMFRGSRSAARLEELLIELNAPDGLELTAEHATRPDRNLQFIRRPAAAGLTLNGLRSTSRIALGFHSALFGPPNGQ